MGRLYAQKASLTIGQSAPEISLPTPEGKILSLSSLKSRLVLIDFWATWCAPCMKEQPELKALYERYKTQVVKGQFEILGVSLDKSKENWEKIIARFQIGWPQVSDLSYWKSPVTKDYFIEDLPFNVLVNEKGNIAAINIHGEALEAFIANHLRKTATAGNHTLINKRNAKIK